MNSDEILEPFGFFNVMGDGRYVPRTIFVDTDPTTIGEFKVSQSLLKLAKIVF